MEKDIIYNCRSKYSKNQEYQCFLTEDNNVYLFKDDFKVIISQSMFNKLFEIYELHN